MSRKSYYLHLLNGQPAVYVPGQGVCFASFYGPPNKLARSLKQLRAEQDESMKRDLEREPKDMWKYSYIRVTP